MSKASGEIRVLVQATQQGFQEASAKIAALAAQVEKLNTAGNQNSFANLEKGMKTLIGTVTTLTNSVNGLTQSFAKSTTSASNFANKLTMQWNFKSIIHDMNQLLAVQMRWYAVQPLATAMQTALYAPFQAAVAIGQYVTEVSQARGELTRWGATTGTVTEEAKRNIESLLNTIQKTTTQFPITFKDLSETVQAFIGAGIPTETVRRMTADFARMKIAFPEIDYKQFAIALTGAYNVFKNTIKNIEDDADGMSAVMDKILAAQATGIIRPEQFTTVLQYMSEIGKLEGFTLDQILALSVAITDTGIKANSASRLLRSMTLSLQSEKGQQTLLDRFGITLDRTLPLAQQFNKIIEEIRDKIIGSGGAGGKVSAGWITALEELVGKEQAGILAALIDKFDRYKEAVKLVEQSHGGLIKSADAMMQTLPGQWLLLTNIVKQFGKEFAGSGIEATMKTIMGTFLDMAQGALAAADNTGMYSGQLDKLGEAGKAVYQVIHGIKEAFKVWGDVLAPVGAAIKVILGVFDDLLVKTGLLETAIKTLIDYLGVRLALGAIPLVIKGFQAIQAALYSLMVSLTLSKGGFAGLGSTITGLVKGGGPIALLLIALGGVEYLLDKINKKSTIEIKETNAFRDYVKTTKSSGLKVELEKLEKTPSNDAEIAKLNADIQKEVIPMFKADLMQKRDTLQKTEDFRTSKIEWIKNELELRKRLKTGENPSSTAPTLAPPPKAEKIRTYGETELGAIKKLYNDAMEGVRIDEEKELRLADISYKKGLVSLEEVEDKKTKIISDASEERRILLGMQAAEAEKQYDKIVAAINADPKLKGESKTNKLEAARKSYVALQEEIKTKEKALSKDEELKSETNELRVYESKKRIEILKAENTERLANETAQTESEIEKSRLSESEKNAKLQYDYLEISALDYYNLLKENAQKEIDLELKVANARVQAAKDSLKQKQDALKLLGGALTTEEEQAENENIKRLEEQVKTLTKLLAQKGIATQANITREAAENYSAIFEQAGFDNKARRLLEMPSEISSAWQDSMGAVSDAMAGTFAVGEKSLDRLNAKWTNTGQIIGEFWEGATQAMADTFQSVFVDNMNGELKSLKEYFESFTKSILQMLFKIAAEQTALKISQGVQLLGSAIFGPVAHKGGVIGESVIPSRSVDSSVFVGAPKFHKGLAPDEFPAILQKGEAVIPKNKVNKTIIDYILNTSVTDIFKSKEKEKEKDTVKSSTLQKTIESITKVIGKSKEFSKVFKDVSSFKNIQRFHTGLVPSTPILSSQKDIISKDETTITDLNSITRDKKKESSVLQKIVDHITSMVSTSANFSKTVSNYRNSKTEDRSTILQKIVESISNTVNKSNEFTKGTVLNVEDAKQTEIAKSSVLKKVIENITTIVTGNKNFTHALSSSKEFSKLTERYNIDSSVFTEAPRFHKGLAPDEFPAVLQKGEAVVPKSKVTKSIIDIITDKTRESNVTKDSTATQKTIENIVELVTKQLSIDNISSDKQAVTELVISYVRNLSTEPLKKPELVKSGVDHFDTIKEKESSIKEISRVSGLIHSVKELSSTLKEKNDVSRLFTTLKENNNVTYLSDVLKEKESHSADTSLKEKSSTNVLNRLFNTLKEQSREKETTVHTGNVISSLVQKISERFTTDLQKESIKVSSDTEKTSRNDTVTRNSDTYRDKSVLQELTEKFSSVIKNSESVVKDNVIYLSDVLKEKEQVSKSTSDSRSVVQKLTDTFTNLSKSVSTSKVFESVQSITDGISSIIESTVNTTSINNSSSVTGVSNVSNNNAGAAAVLSFHKGGIVPKFHLGGLVLPKLHTGGLIPVFHGGGLNDDERMAVLQTGERVLSRDQTIMMDNMYNRVMNVTNNNNNKPTNVQVNIINQSSQNVKAEQKGTTFDMEKTVVSIVLKDMSTNGAIYGAVKGVR